MISILIGDLHLGSGVSIGKVGIGSNLNSRIVDQLNLLDWCLDQAIDLFAENIIITGDIFHDPKPHPSLITLFISWLKKCQAHAINVHLIVGNHDILRSGFNYSSPLDIISEVEMEHIFVHKNLTSIILGTTCFTFVPFRDRKSFAVNSNVEALSILKNNISYELAGLPLTYRKILIGHLAIEGSIPVGDEIDDIANELFCPIEMFNGYDYVWMGHVHKPQVLNKAPHIAHIGSMDVSNFGETDHKKYIIILDENGFSTKNLPTRELKKISISIPKEIENTTEYVLSEIKKIKSLDKSIIKVEVSLENQEMKSIDKSIIEKYLLNNGAFNVSHISESKKSLLVKKHESMDSKMDVMSAIKKYAESQINEEIRSSFIDLASEIYVEYKSGDKV